MNSRTKRFITEQTIRRYFHNERSNLYIPWHLPLIVMFVCGFLSAVSLHANDSQSGKISTIVTRQQTFTIPFQVPAGQQFSEVQLHVAERPQMDWRLYSRQLPSVGGFTFRAAQDADIVFAVRSVDHRGKQYPAGPLRPELLVIVDTAPPQMDLELKLGAAGQLQTSWIANDARLDPDSLTVEYQPTAESRWIPMAIERRSGKLPQQQSLKGQASWWPQSLSTIVRVRGQIKDTAGNATVVQRQISLRPTDTQTARHSPAPQSSTHELTTTPHHHRMDGSVPWSSSETRQTTEAERTRTAPVSRSDLSSTQRPNRSFRTSGNHSPANAHPNTTHHFASDSQATTSLTSAAFPQGVDPLHTQSSKFSLEYDIKMIGPTGVKTVHLWGTTDGGQTWARWLHDPDRTSPVHIEAPGAGVYGFRILVENNEGLALSPPQPGDLPAVWVVVDPVQPEVELTSAKYGRGLDEGTLLITWQARDNYLASRPVTLRYTSDPSSSWQTIAAHLPNSGQYTWRVDRHVPQQAFLQIEVRDMAGNIGIHSLTEPINTRGLVPRALIRGVRSHRANR